MGGSKREGNKNNKGGKEKEGTKEGKQGGMK
jgi:hypothetical protein